MAKQSLFEHQVGVAHSQICHGETVTSMVMACCVSLEGCIPSLRKLGRGKQKLDLRRDWVCQLNLKAFQILSLLLTP